MRRPLIRRAPSNTERRVYVLPANLVDRVRAYADEKRLGSEVAAVRELLNLALDEHARIRAGREELDILSGRKVAHFISAN